MGTTTTDPTARRLEDLPDLITIPELAEFTGMSVPTLARWRMEGLPPKALRLGTAVRYPKASVIAWLDSLEDAS